MNATQKKALVSAISNAEDNLNRAKFQKKRRMSYKTDNGKTIDEVIAGYQKRLDELKEGIDDEKEPPFDLLASQDRS